ncbi:hemagglutinin repeat-containing protein, partial [Paraburkholderia caffeinitolerans]
NGHLEVAGNRAEVVIANPSGIAVNGGGFINTSRAILTTGTPNYAGNGSLSGFNVTGGNITVSGAGLDASNVDQVDLLSRAVQANAAIYAKNLNVVTGANRVDHDTLAATPIAGDGPAQGVSIDVSHLGGMYANRIVLVGTELGVGVSTRGVLAAQAGDLVLTSAGKLVLAGQTSASGNIGASAHDGIDNSGTTYAQQDLNASTAGALTNNGTLAAQRNVFVNAGNVVSSGTIGAGVNGDGVVTQAAALTVSASGAVSATGHNLSGGDAVFSGHGLNFSGGNTSATGSMTLNAGTGDANLSSATVKAGRTLAATTAGTLTTDNAAVSSGSTQTLNAEAMSNRSGQIVSGGALNTNVGGALNNQHGTMQAAGPQSVFAGSLDNSAGHILSLNGDGLNLGVAGTLLNGLCGVIGGNGNVQANAYRLTNLGQITALGHATLSAWDLVNSGTTAAGGALNVSATGALSNAGGTFSGASTTVSGASIDNTRGNINGDTLALSATNDLVNTGGAISQSGTAAQTLSAGGRIDNTGGTIASNATDLTVQGTSVTNDSGAIQHAGAGKLNVSGASSVSNVSGRMATNGSASITGSTVDNTRGTMTAQQHLNSQAQRLVNESGTMAAGQTLDVSSFGALDNRGGSMTATTAAVSGASVDNSNGDIKGDSVTVSTPGDLVNQGGKIVQSGAGAQAVTAGGRLDNSNNGQIASNAQNLMVAGATVDNDGGKVLHAGSGKLDVKAAGKVSNVGGQIASNGSAGVTGSTVDNTRGTMTAQQNLSAQAQTLINESGRMAAGQALAVAASGALDNRRGSMTATTTTISGASVDNSNGDIEGDSVAVSTPGDLVNQGGKIVQSGTGAQTVTAGVKLDNSNGGQIASNAQNLTVAGASIDNNGGKVLHAGSGKLDVTATGNVSNAGGEIGTNGSAAVAGSTVDNRDGAITAKHDASISGQTVVNENATVGAGNALDVKAAGVLDNRGGALIGTTTTVSGSSIDNTNGDIEGTAVSVSTPGDLTNESGTIAQSGAGAQTITAGRTLDNSSGGRIATNASSLSVTAAQISNDGGAVTHAGTGMLDITATGALSNVSGQIASNGSVATQSASLDNSNGNMTAQHIARIAATNGIVNRNGLIYGQDHLSASTRGNFDNTDGAAQSGGDLALTAGGALLNRGGAVAANGAHGMMNVAAGAIDNANGALTNAGDGATTVSATDIDNTAGTLGGNGDLTLNGQTLENGSGGQVVAGGTGTLAITSTIGNSGGTLYGGKGLNVGQATTAVINDGGAILGGLDVSANVAAFSNENGSVRANRDIAASGAISGDGKMTAGRNLSLDISDDYTTGTANRLNADADMSIHTSGTLTNTGELAAGGALKASGTNVVNAAGADMNSSATTVTASNTITNAGLIEGDAVTTRSATLDNTGGIIGNTVAIHANDVTNTGAAAVIAGVEQVSIYASDSVTNADGALIYSAGNLEIAKNGARDASGVLANQTGTLTNRAADIEAEGDIDIAAHTVNNIRTGAQTEAGTPESSSSALTLWTADLGSDLSSKVFSTYQSLSYPQWRWNPGGIGTEVLQKLAKPISVTLPASQVTNIDTSTQSFSLTTPLTDRYMDSNGPNGVWSERTITSNPTQYYQSLTQNADGTVTIAFWPDWDAKTQIRPDQAVDMIRYDIEPDNHDYVPVIVTTTTTTQTDRLVSAGTAAQIIAQGAIRINSDGGSINNASSTMAAGGDLVRRAMGGSVNDTGTVLQQTGTQTVEATYFWHQKSGGNSHTHTEKPSITPLAPTTVDALPAIATSNQTVQTDAQTITINSVDRHGETVTGSGVAGGDATGTQLGSVTTNGSATSVAGVTGQGGGATSVTGVSGQDSHAQTVNTTDDQTTKPQTLGTASSGIPDLKLPVNALYTYQSAPDASYLIETNPRFTSYTKFISSDYMLDQLGLDPARTAKRLGDGYYETMLIRNQVTQLTGRALLAGYADNLAEYTALMNNGVKYAKDFGLAPGVGLSSAQMAQLTTDMVWLVSQSVTLPDGSQQDVLVPKLYLAQSNTVDLKSSGALVAGNQVIQNATGEFSNSGHVVGDVATTVIGNTVTNRGVIGSGGATTVSAVQDVNNLGGRIGGVDTIVAAGRDINNVSTTAQASVSSDMPGFHSSASGMAVQSVATISGSNSVSAVAARDVKLAGSAITSGGDTTVAAGRDIDAGAITLTATHDAGTVDGLNGRHVVATHEAGSAVTGAGNVTTLSGRDTTLTGSSVAAGGDVAMGAGGHLTVTAAKDTASYSGQSMGGSIAQSKRSSYDERVQGSSVSAGGNTTLAAGQGGSGDLNIMGSSVTAATGATTIAATGDVNIGGVTETHDAQSWSHHDSSGFLSRTQTTDASESHQTLSIGSTVAGDSVNGAAGRDMTISGSTVAATNDVNLAAANNLTVTTTQDTSQNSTFHEERKSGFGALSGGGLSINYGNRDQKDTAHDTAVTNNASLVGSTDGSVNMAAGKDLRVTGSDIIAAQNVTGTGANVTIEAAQGTTRHDESHEMKQSGFTVGLAGSVGDAINNAISETQAANNSSGKGDSRAAALHGIAAANDAFMGGAGVADLASGDKPDIGVKVSFGTSQSRSDASENRTIHSGSSVQAGGTAAFVATGDGTPGSGNVTIAGSNVNANDVVLAAKDQVNVVNTTDTDSTRSSNSSSSASVGVQYTLGGGFGVSASMSNAHGDANSDAQIQNASHVNGANSVTVVSGGDTNIIGSQVNGGKVIAHADGNLNIVSVQDVTSSAAHQSSAGGGFTISQGGGSASISAQNGHADGKYAGVNEQAGINAGTGGFDINVKGNTDLTGAVITSEADTSKNNLTTGTLTFSDIANHSEYSASSNGISAGMGIANTSRAVGPGSVSNGGGVSPMLPQSDSGSSDATTRSAVSAGTINIMDGANQKQDVASLSRDTVDTNGKVANTPDLNALLNQQADRMQAAQAAGQAVAQRIGDYADAQAKATHDPAWAEGGDKRAAMQAAGAAVVAGLGGGVGSAVAGAAGAAIGSKMAPTLNELSGSIAASNPTGDADVNKALGNIVANVVATGAGAAAGGAGAFASSNVDLYNRQLHPDEKDAIKDKAGDDKAEQDRLTRAACYAVKCWAEYPQGSDQYNANYVSQLEASQLGPELQWVNNQKEAGLFDYTPTQKIGDMVKSDPLGVAKDAATMGIGAYITATGVKYCATGVACGVGSAMAVSGTNDVATGMSGLYNRYNGIPEPGMNPLQMAFTYVSPTWGPMLYDAASLGVGIAALTAPVPLKMGWSDGLNRPQSMFDVTVPKFGSTTTIPVLKWVIPGDVNAAIQVINVGTKGAKIVDDARNAGQKK